MGQQTEIDTFIFELRKHIDLFPYQEEVVRKMLLNSNNSCSIYFWFGRQNGLAYLRTLYKAYLKKSFINDCS